MLQAKWGVPSASKPKKTQPCSLSDDELRCRIFANAAILFPSASPTNAYEVVYASKPRASNTAELPWQYAMLVRRTPSGEYVPLMRGNAWSSTSPWSLVLLGLLDATAMAVHKKVAKVECPAVGAGDDLPEYEPAQ